MAEPSVLLVDEDPRRRRALEVGVRRAGFRVTVAGSAEQALWFLEHALPVAIVSASGLSAGMSSVSFAEMIRGSELWSGIVLVMLDDREGTDGPLELELELELADGVVDQHVTIPALCSRLRQLLLARAVESLVAGTSRRLAGTLDEMSPIDLLRLIERLGVTGTLEVETFAGPATLWSADGRIIDAQLGRFSAEEAVFRLLMASEGTFEVVVAANQHAEVVQKSMSELMRECLRDLDEWMRLCEDFSSLDARLVPDEELLESKRGGLSQEQLALIRRCDGHRSIRDVVDASSLGLLLTLEALNNLRNARVLGEVASAGEVAGVGELPPAPAFPEPFPGLSAETLADDEEDDEHGSSQSLSLSLSISLMSGLLERAAPPEEPPPGEEPSQAPAQRPPDASASGRRYVFRPPNERSREPQMPSEPIPSTPSTSTIERAIDAAISGLWSVDDSAGEDLEGLIDQGLAIPSASSGAANERPVLEGLLVKGEGAAENASEDEDEDADADEASGDKPEFNRLGKIVPLVHIREPTPGSSWRGLYSQSTTSAGSSSSSSSTATPVGARVSAGEVATSSAEVAGLAVREEAMSVALRAPSVLINIEECVAASISATRQALSSKIPSGIVVGEIIDPDVELESRTDLELVPHSGGDLERLGAYVATSAPSTSAAMWSSGNYLASQSTASLPTPSVRRSQPDSEASAAAELGPEELAALGGSMRWPVVSAVVSALLVAGLAWHYCGPGFGSGFGSGFGFWGAGSSPDVHDREEPDADEPAEKEGPPLAPVPDTAENSEASERSEAPKGADAAQAEENGASQLAQPRPDGDRKKKNVKKRLTRGQRLLKRGSLTQAQALADELLSEAPNDPGALVLRAKILLEQGELAESLTVAQKVVDAHPDYSEAYLTIGVAHDERAEVEDAIAAYERYLELTPDARYAGGIRRQVADLRRKLP